MKPDDEQFEQRLQRQPMRAVPSSWRKEILRVAQQTESSRQAPPVARQDLFSILGQRLSALLWPHPRAWGALAAAWMVILFVNLALRDDSPAAARHIVPPSPQIRELLREQDQLFAELIGAEPAVSPTKVIPLQPHSYYRDEISNA